MILGIHKAIFAVSLLLVSGLSTRADTYSTFQTTRYYSANQRYVLKITPNKRATLFRSDRRLTRLWSRMLHDIPRHLFVSNDGSRVVMIDHYYGNGGEPTNNVVLFFDETGQQIAGYTLDEVANLSRVMQTISSSHWYYGALFDADQSRLIVESVAKKCEPAAGSSQTGEVAEDLDKCMTSQPYEELQFSMATGKLISRVSINDKYVDLQIRLIHELELAENEQPRDELSLAYAQLNLAKFYEEQKQYVKASEFYEKAIPIYIKELENYAGDVIGVAATNYRKMGDKRKAEKYYRRALDYLDKNQGKPESVRVAAVRVYEDYADLLDELDRKAEAARMIRRAEVILSVYPDFKPR